MIETPSTLTVPAPLLPYVRRGLYSVLSDLAPVLEKDTLSWWHALDRSETPDLPPCREVVDRITRAGALLDVVGWEAAELDDVAVRLSEHGDTLCVAVGDELEDLTEQRSDADIAALRALASQCGAIPRSEAA